MSQEQKCKKYHLLIVGPLNFPRGSASSSRVRAYAKGLQDNGASVTVLCYRPIGLAAFGDREIPAEGSSENIRYRYSPGITVRPSNLIVQLWHECKGILNAFRIIRKMHKTEGIDAILFYGYDTLMGGLFAALGHCLGIQVLEEKCEYQFLQRKNMLKRVKAYIYEHFIVPRFDGMLIMTQALEDHYLPLMKKKAHMLRMPILVDLTRFENAVQVQPEKYIAYCGDPTGNKDGVPLLLETFAKITSVFPEYKLYIIGASYKIDRMEQLVQKVKLLGIDKNVVFTGKISPDEVPAHLAKASVLVLARPSSLQAAYGFPTKLGEYLATGRPVVVTQVGEIGEYLKDGQNAFIAEPDSIQAFADKLTEVLNDLDKAKCAGIKGRETAEKFFDYQINGQRLFTYLQIMKNNKKH